VVPAFYRTGKEVRVRKAVRAAWRPEAGIKEMVLKRAVCGCIFF
jgi:hypothetical protein